MTAGPPPKPDGWDLWAPPPPQAPAEPPSEPVLHVVPPAEEPPPEPPPDAEDGHADSGDSQGEPDSWTPMRIGDVMRQIAAGTRPRPRTEILRPDGCPEALLYRARVNLIFGPATSGKTWVALLAIAEVLQAGGTVVFIDLEDYRDLLADRLLDLGVDPDLVDAGLWYVEQPEKPLTLARAELIGAAADLVVVDALGGLMALAGLDPDKNLDVLKVKPHIFRLARGGACVIVLDHTAKADLKSLDSIGAQSKRSILTGASYRAVNVEPFHRNGGGSLLLVVAKDRAGGVPYPQGRIAARLVQHDPGGPWALDLLDGRGDPFEPEGR